ncbi:uncharacterized protein LOC124350012 [Daphnia pulicaria]|uniref:uncharacterized protein LOC124350012 n=1 Tax=Daphnia pulicaria TaxID=35523 RepID=UPI001EEA95E1|nr:uncharacterized protein LOC124350012 [Daphnia pulicaria]XP_046656942.1 uncharacterized protein LOC124350012 [Daphnia pulicaria]XP_046656943.1 uncharacterized protein LOC124350012 [Daphnia pulicaria]
MAFSNSASIALLLVATICCSIVNAGQVVPLPSAVDRQSKQIYLAPSQFYNYYDPGFQYQMLIPTEIDNSKLTSAGDDSEPEALLQGRQNLPITATPAAAECLIADSGKNGLGGCTKGSQAASGNIDLKFTAAKQGVVIALVPNPRRYSKVKITCSEITDKVMAFTKTAKIAATKDTPVTELKQTQILVVSAADKDVFKCSWESS